MAEEDKGLWETIKPDMVKLLTVGVLGSVLSGVFGFATWVRDKRLARLEENIKNAEQFIWTQLLLRMSAGTAVSVCSRNSHKELRHVQDMTIVSRKLLKSTMTC